MWKKHRTFSSQYYLAQNGLIMELYYRTYGESGQPPMVILHGLFGMSDNWATIAKSIAEEGFEVFVPDQRNHGRSGHSNIHNYEAMVDDLLEFLDAREFEKIALLGHSMGGKTAMQFSFDYPERVQKLIVADISPSASTHGSTHVTIIDRLIDIDLSRFSSRRDVMEHMKEVISNPRLRQFLQKNLYWKDRASLGWRINFDAIRNNLEEIFRPVEADEDFDKPVLFLRGEASDYVPDEDVPRIEEMFPQVKIKTISGASHWLHAEQPEQFLREVNYFLKQG